MGGCLTRKYCVAMSPTRALSFALGTKKMAGPIVERTPDHLVDTAQHDIAIGVLDELAG